MVTAASATPVPARARRIEIAAWLDLYRAAPDALVRAHQVGCEARPGAALVYAAGIDHPFLNRAWLSAPDPVEARAVAARYRALGVTRFMIHVAETGGDGAWISRAGLTRYRRDWVELIGRIGARPAPPVRWPHPIEAAGPDDAAACGRLMCDGFDVPSSAAPLFAAALGRPGWDVLVARAPDRGPVGIGLLFCAGDVAYLAGAATARPWRGRGVQGALMAARVALAAARGCAWVRSETGAPAAGDPQHSQTNMERHGLDVVGRIANLVDLATVWDHGVAAAE